MPVKKIDGLPSATDIEKEITQDELQEQIERRKSSRKKIFRPILLILGVVAIVLLTLLFTNQNVPSNVVGTGSIYGNVVNEAGSPIPAEIAVSSTNINTLADLQGNFNLSNIPTGKNDIFITYLGQGVVISVEMQKDQVLSLGSIQVRSTQIPAR
ncbi:MAG: carboxypeptidase-like regulatory domain-containing protein [Anaerolineaceae bacterium]